MDEKKRVINNKQREHSSLEYCTVVVQQQQ